MATVYQSIQINYVMPQCGTCGSYMKLEQIKNIEPSEKKKVKGLDQAAITLDVMCENTACEAGFMREVEYKLYDPKTHYTKKLKKKKE